MCKTPYLDKKPSSLRYYQDGPPTSVDLDTWQIEITGLVDQTVSFSYRDILALAQVTEHRRTVCVCNWSIRRNWTGVLVKDLLDIVGVQRAAYLYLRQTSLGTPEKGVYESTISLGDAVARRAMLIHSVDGNRLPLEQGYPVRLIDFGLYGYKSVKAVTKLEVTNENRLGKWEMLAGYDVDGTIRVKKYWIVDLRQHKFLPREGEVTGF